MDIKIFRSRHLAAVIALLLLTCGTPSRAWCKAKQSLWAADTSNDRVLELSPSELKSSGTPAGVEINGAALDSPGGVAFDRLQNLWVTTLDDTVLQFTPAQLRNLSTVSDPTPNATIGSTMFDELVGCTLDQHGNLWLIDRDGDGIHELSET